MARAVKLKKRSWPAASRRSSTLVMPSLHSSVTCAPHPVRSHSLPQLHCLSCHACTAVSPAPLCSLTALTACCSLIFCHAQLAQRHHLQPPHDDALFRQTSLPLADTNTVHFRYELSSSFAGMVSSAAGVALRNSMAAGG